MHTDVNFKWKIFFLLFAGGNFINGIWMLVDPGHWYTNLPGRVPDFGPLNEHFVRDLGCLFLMFAVLAIKGALQSDWRGNALFIMQLWYLPHAFVHLFDTFRGLVAMEHLYMDIPLCYAPPLVIGILQLVLRRETNQAGKSRGQS